MSNFLGWLGPVGFPLVSSSPSSHYTIADRIAITPEYAHHYENERLLILPVLLLLLLLL